MMSPLDVPCKPLSGGLSRGVREHNRHAQAGKSYGFAIELRRREMHLLYACLCGPSEERIENTGGLATRRPINVPLTRTIARSRTYPTEAGVGA
jgi:hypothetical protein